MALQFTNRVKKNVNKYISKAPAKMRKKFIEEGGRIYTVDRLCHNKGYQGLYETETKFIYLDSEARYNKNARYHEFGHYIDTRKSPWTSESDKFKKIYEKERHLFERKNGHYTDLMACSMRRVEFFAYCFEYYITEPKHLKKHCPKAYKFMKELCKNF